MIQCRYLTAFEKPREELEISLYMLMDDLGASSEQVRINPLSGLSELEAVVNQNFEFILTVRWNYTVNSSDPSTLVTFDVELATPVEPHRLNEALAIPAETYFPPLVLVYNSYGRERSLRLFPLLLDLENAFRELIITVMLTRFGPNWWKNVIVGNDLNRSGDLTAEDSRQRETQSKLHDSLAMHPLYYMDLKALREIMDKVDELVGADIQKSMPDPTNFSRRKRHQWEQDLAAQLPFASILENHDNISITAKISEIRELRNRLMHGRYLTESNEQVIFIICQQIHRFLVLPGHIGHFNDRKLVNQ